MSLSFFHSYLASGWRFSVSFCLANTVLLFPSPHLPDTYLTLHHERLIPGVEISFDDTTCLYECSCT